MQPQKLCTMSAEVILGSLLHFGRGCSLDKFAENIELIFITCYMDKSLCKLILPFIIQLLSTIEIRARFNVSAINIWDDISPVGFFKMYYPTGIFSIISGNVCCAKFKVKYSTDLKKEFGLAREIVNIIKNENWYGINSFIKDSSIGYHLRINFTMVLSGKEWLFEIRSAPETQDTGNIKNIPTFDDCMYIILFVLYELLNKKPLNPSEKWKFGKYVCYLTRVRNIADTSYVITRFDPAYFYAKLEFPYAWMPSVQMEERLNIRLPVNQLFW